MILTINPGDSYGLKENSDENRIARSIAIQELEEVKSAFRARRQSHEEIQRKEAGDEQFAMTSDRRELVTESCDYRFGTPKLEPQLHNQTINIHNKNSKASLSQNN